MRDVPVIIVGAGPIGLELAVVLKRAGVKYLHLEAGQVGQTMTWWPRNTTFFSSPERIALAGLPLGRLDQGKVTGEEYLCYLRQLVDQFDLDVQTYERVTAINRADDGFHLQAETLAGTAEYRARHVVLATGGMARPNKLGIPGEDLPSVSHYFEDPHTYFRQRLLIVGGKNSALEAALRCWRAGAEVTISYRRAAFDLDVVKRWLGPEVNLLIEKGQIHFLPETTPVAVEPGKVTLAPTRRDEQGRYRAREDAPPIVYATDFVLLLTGYEADMSLFAMAGVTLEGPEQRPIFNPETMETNVPGLYVAGTATAGTQHDFKVFIETSHTHVARIAGAITGRAPKLTGSVIGRRHDYVFSAIPTDLAES